MEHRGEVRFVSRSALGIVAVMLLLAGCSGITLVADYDQQTDQAVTALRCAPAKAERDRI